MRIRYSMQFRCPADVFTAACSRVEQQVHAIVTESIKQVLKERSMVVKKAATPDDDDIFGDIPTTTTKGSEMKDPKSKTEKAAVTKAAVAASAAKHAKPAAPAKAAVTKAAPAKKAAPAPAKKGGAKGGHGKFYYPVGSAEREGTTAKLVALVKKKKSITTKEAAVELGIPTFKARLSAVDAQEQKLLKMVIEKGASVFTLKAK